MKKIIFVVITLALAGCSDWIGAPTMEAALKKCDKNNGTLKIREHRKSAFNILYKVTVHCRDGASFTLKVK